MEEELLTVAAVARRIGVAPATLRTWDRRYGLGPSSHEAGEHRRYCPNDLAKLALMRRLITTGVSPADAAEKAKAHQLATPNIGLLTDIICCPGGDFCSLANAKSIPIATSIQEAFDDLDYLHDIGELELNISGCMNACGHHHIGHIGVLGVDKDGSEWYQVTIGGKQGNDASLGAVIGPSFAAEEMPGVVKKLIDVYIKNRNSEERFIDTVRRLGVNPFKEHVYA